MATTELYLIRHGLAGQHGDYTNDPIRPLSEEGQRKTKQIGKRLRDLELRFDLILTSPLVRARQTAEILQACGLGKQLEESDFLSPSGDFNQWLTWLDQWQQAGDRSLAVVGHEPGLSEWAEQLVWGEVRHQLTLKKAGVIGLTLPESGSPVGCSQLFWLAPPRLLL